MKFLAIDTSAKKLAVAVRNADMVRAFDVDCAMQHSVRLMDEIDGALKSVGLAVNDCDFLVCAVGPGSFTGIRIGIATVKGLCFATEKKALAVTSLDVIAYAEKEENKIALVNAGHGYVYAQGYGEAVFEAGYYPLEEVLARGEAANALLLSTEEIAGVDLKLVSAAEGLMNASEALHTKAASSSELAAVYLRKSNAEEGR